MGDVITVTNYENPGGRTPSGEMPENLNDENRSTKWLDFNMQNCRTNVFDFLPKLFKFI